MTQGIRGTQGGLGDIGVCVHLRRCPTLSNLPGCWEAAGPAGWAGEGGWPGNPRLNTAPGAGKWGTPLPGPAGGREWKPLTLC